MSIIDPDEESLQAQLHPLKGYEELEDVLDPVTGRLLGHHGILGMTIEDAARRAEVWWDKTARGAMPDMRRDDGYLNKFGIKSGIINGLPWARLNKGERIQIVKIWHEHIGIPLHGMGFNQHQGKEYTDVIRKFDLARIFENPHADAQGRA